MNEYTYIAIKNCGCHAGAVVDVEDDQKWIADHVVKFLRRGYKIERVKTQWVRENLTACKCGKQISLDL